MSGPTGEAAGTGTAHRARSVFFAVLGLLVALSTIWSLATPLGASPDENEHIVRAATVVRGQVVAPDAAGRAPLDVVVKAPADYAAALNAPLCYAFDQRVPAGCEGPFTSSTATVSASIYVGRYPPVYYALIGWPTLLFKAPLGFYLSRLVSAVLIDALMAFAVTLALLRGRSTLPLAALLLALTPEALYLSAVVNPSSLEVAGATAFWMGLVTLATRYRDDPPRPLLAGIGISGVLLTVARPISPVWTLVAIAVVSPAWWGRAALRRLVSRWETRAVAAALVVAAAGTTAWTLAEHGLRTIDGPLPAAGTSLVTIAHDAIGEATGYVQQAVGVFGLAVPVPQIVVIGWVALVGALVVMAWARLVSRQERSMLTLMVAAALVLPTAIVVAGARTHGLIGFGRYFLPLYLGLPVVAGGIAGEHGATEDRRVARLVLGVTAAGQVVAFYWCLHRYLVGSNGPVSPLSLVPGGWRPPVPGLLLDLLFAGAMIVVWRLGRAAIDDVSQPGASPSRGSIRDSFGLRRLVVPSGTGDRQWAELDGIRAVAVGVVTCFHLYIVFYPSWNPLRPSGGFLAVDVFFVISGFLITGLLLAERRQRGRISLPAFYGRRALRLFPALALLLVVVGGLAALLRAQPWSFPTIHSLPWVIFYVGNWKAAVHGGTMPLGALSHTWSLSVEEQFYALWPLALILCLRWVRSVRAVGAALLLLTVAEWVYRFEALHRGWTVVRTYYASDFRFDSLALGCALACFIHGTGRDTLGVRARRLIMAGGVVGTVGLALLTMRESYYVSLSALWFGIPAASLCTAAMVASIALAPAPGVSHLLRLRPLVWVGKRSYGMYLWITADFYMLHEFAVPQLGLNLYNVLVTAGSVAIAAASYRYVEMPFLRLKKVLQRVRADRMAQGAEAPAVAGPDVIPVRAVPAAGAGSA